MRKQRCRSAVQLISAFIFSSKFFLPKSKIICCGRTAWMCLTWSESPKTGFLLKRLICQHNGLNSLVFLIVFSCSESFYYSRSSLLISLSTLILPTLKQTKNEPHHEKTCLRRVRPGTTQTGLYNQRRWLEA